MADAPASQRLWSDSRGVARACLAHPFVQGLRDGSLSGARYRVFIAQDAFFLDAFARAYALGVARAPDRGVMRALHALQCGIFEEQRLHESVAAGAGIDLAAVHPLPATSAYTDFLVAVSFTGPLGELLAGMTPCMRLYRFLGEELFRSGAAHTYRVWIETYAASEYGHLVDTIEGLFDQHAVGSAREAANYRRAMELECQFFDSAWEAGRG